MSISLWHYSLQKRLHLCQVSGTVNSYFVKDPEIYSVRPSVRNHSFCQNGYFQLELDSTEDWSLSEGLTCYTAHELWPHT